MSGNEHARWWMLSSVQYDVTPTGTALTQNAGGWPALLLTCAGQDQGDVVGLFVVADPVVDGHGNDLANLWQGEAAIVANQIDEALLAELAEIIFRLGDPVAVSQENFARMHFDGFLVVGHVVKKPHYRPAGFQPADGAISAN